MPAGCKARTALNDTVIVTAYNAAVALQHKGRRHEAAAVYRQVLQMQPEHPETLNNLGRILFEQGQWNEARRCLELAASSKPEFAEPQFNLGDLFRVQGEPAVAADHYRQAARLKPSMAEAWNNLGNILKAQGDLPGAIDCYRHGVRLHPELAETHYNLGSALREAGYLEPAVLEFMEALRLRPDYAEAHNNLGLTWKGCGAQELAVAAFSRAIEINPGMAEARWNRSFFNLLDGHFREGWQDYESRFCIPQWKFIYPFRLNLPRWNGEVDKTKTILVHDEQGFGDTLQFVRYLPMVRQRCGRVILETRRELLDLLRGFPGADERVERPAGHHPPVAADACVPLLSLPGIFGTTLETIPAPVPYLHADPEKTNLWARRLQGPELKIGMVWAGRLEHSNDRNRSCPLELFLPLMGLPGLRWFGLQKGPAAAQSEIEPISRMLVNWGTGLKDFSDTAAAIAQLDLVLSVDTAVVHLAGAMGKPVWVLLSFVSDWRWMTRREDSPWYPTMRLFRQATPGDWPGVFRRVAEDLERLSRLPRVSDRSVRATCGRCRPR
jgi:Flp pilus assembly protein TadD